MSDAWDGWLWTSNSPEFYVSEPVRSPRHRFDIERAKLRSAWETIVVDPVDGVIAGIFGTVETVSERVRDFRIVVPARYPYSSPRAYADGWNPGAMHTYQENELCLWRAHHWMPRYTLAYAVAKTYTWIHKHDIYLDTGEWPGNEQEH